MSMREIFIDGLQEGRAIWGQQCAVEVKEAARKPKPPEKEKEPLFVGLWRKREK